MTVTLLENFRAVFYAPFYAAFALGAFEAEGVDVRLAASGGPSGTPNALAGGAGDVSWGGPMRVMREYDRNPASDLVIFCEVVRRDPFFLIGREPMEAFRLQDMAGKKIATVSEVPTPWMCLQHDLRLAGMDPAEVDRIGDRTMAENAAALRAGEIDAVQIFQPFAEELAADGAGHIWYAGADRGLTSYTAFYTTREFMEREPDAPLGMTRAMHRTLKWIAGHGGDEIAECVASFLPDIPKKPLAESVERYKSLGIWNEAPILEREGYDWLQAAFVSGGMIEKGCPYERAVENRFAEASAGDDPPSM